MPKALLFFPLILGLLAVTGAKYAGAGRLDILLLTESFPGTDAAFVDALKTSLEAQGFVVRSSDAAGLKVELVTEHAPSRLLILPNSACFPVDSRQALMDYLSAGGNLLTIGGPPLSRQVVRLGDEWLTEQMLLEKLETMPPGQVVLDFSRFTPSPDYYRDTGAPEVTPQIRTMPSGIESAGMAMEVKLSACPYWEFQDIPVTNPFPAGETATTFWAKGDANTRMLTVAWIDSDDARWNTRIPLTTEWKRYSLTSEQFVHWKGPGGPEDKLDTRKIVRFKVGFENHNLRDPAQPATFRISDVRSMHNPAGSPDFTQPLIETMSPFYKTYQTDAAGLVPTFGSYSALSTQPAIKGPVHLVCSLPRYRGLGFNKTAPHRWIPVLAAKMADGHIGGAAAAIYVQDDDKLHGSVWATFGIEDGQFIAAHRDEVAREVTSLARRIDEGLYLLSAGADRASYLEQTPRAGAVILNPGGATGDVEIKCTITADLEYAGARLDAEEPRGRSDSPVPEYHSGETRALGVRVRPGSSRGKRIVRDLGTLKGLAPGFYVSTVHMLRRGVVIDEIRQPFSIVDSKPVDKSELVTIKGDQFIYKGKPWYSLGINYRPLYVASMEKAPFWKYWTHPDQYDAEIIEIELDLMNKIGLNTVALIYPDIDSVPPAFVDFLERAHRHGLKAHVYIAGMEPMFPAPEKTMKLINLARLWERPAMFAYDLGWEVRIGREEKRQVHDAAWKRWIEDRYGSVENAERDWQFALRQDEDGRVHGPTDDQVTNDGPWKRMVAAYRRFWDDRLSRRYMETEEIMRRADPYHPIGVRSGFGGTGTLAAYAVPTMPVDLWSGAKHLDYISPEGYNFTGDEQSFREGGFTTLYGKFVSGGKPVYWAELGASVSGRPSPELMESQREHYEKIYRTFYETRSAGSAAWWWPGYLIWEGSDYSVINPDFTLRPSALEFTKMAKLARKPYPQKKPDYWISIDRDLYTNGYAGILADKRKEYGKAVSEGKTVGLRTEGTGTDSATFPRIAVGNTPLNGHNPPKYLNAEFNSLQIRDANGKWKTLQDDGSVTVKAGAPIEVRARLGNIAEAKWLAPKGDRPGAVYLKVTVGDVVALAPIAADTPFFSDADVPSIKLTDGITSETRASLQMITANTVFGERWYVTLIPAKP